MESNIKVAAAIEDKAGDELAERTVSSVAFQASVKELAALLTDANLEDTGSDIPKTEVKRAFPDVSCDVCEKNIFDTRYKCLDCDDYDVCLDCVEARAVEHPKHRFLPIYEGGWRQRVPTGKMIRREAGEVTAESDGEARPSSSSDDTDGGDDEGGDDESDNHALSKSQLAARLAQHLQCGSTLEYSDISVGTSPDTASIRLLYLWPGPPNTAILGHLQTVSLQMHLSLKHCPIAGATRSPSSSSTYQEHFME